MTKSEMAAAIEKCIVDATVTKDGVEVDSYSECYLALAQDLDGTLPEGYVVEWGPCSAHNKRIIGQSPSEIWDAATRGELSL